MAAPLETDPIVFARDENNDLIIPLRKASGQEAVMILVRTELKLWRDELFLNRDQGTPWIETDDGVVTERDAIFGQPFDQARLQRVLRARILSVPGASDVSEFKAAFDGAERSLSVSAVVKTRFGDAELAFEITA